MSPRDRRFDELVDRWLGGDDSGLEQARELAASDPALALELRMLERTWGPARPLDESDEHMLERMIARAVPDPAAQPSAPSAAHPPRELLRVAVAAMALLGFMGTVAAAYWAGERMGREEAAPPDPAVPSIAPPDPAPPDPAVPSIAPPDPAPPSTAPPTTAPPPEPTAGSDDPPPNSETGSSSAEVDRTRSRGGPATAAALFERAGQARRGGRPGLAARLYLQLQSRYPDSREGLTSRLSLARLQLSQLHDPRAAIRQLDGYLRRAPTGPLAPECEHQRAMAFRQLGQTVRERQALERLIRAHPGSVYVPVARRRLRELAASEQAHAPP